MKDTMILKDGTTVELEVGASLAAIQVAAADRTAMLQIWQKLTEENLAEVQIKNGSGLTVGTYTGLVACHIGQLACQRHKYGLFWCVLKNRRNYLLPDNSLCIGSVRNMYCHIVSSLFSS